VRAATGVRNCHTHRCRAHLLRLARRTLCEGVEVPHQNRHVVSVVAAEARNGLEFEVGLMAAEVRKTVECICVAHICHLGLG